MDFFARQERVRRVSRSFFAAFVVTAALTVIILGIVITQTMLSLAGLAGFKESLFGPGSERWWVLCFSVVCPLLAAFIIIVAIRQTRAIREGGGVYVAERLGGAELTTAVTATERRLINVIEEMAVASGLPRPRIYTLEYENGINALTAGPTLDQTVIVVTRGLTEKLNREQVQAVAAHEFAHILNGDSTIAVATSGWLYGLECVSLWGEYLMSGHVLARLEHGRFNPLFLPGLTIWLTGLIGRIMGEILERLFSRQREYLADSFSAQFTRYPQALADALKKIGGVRYGGAVMGGRALALNSYFFVSPIRYFSLLPSHPPLEKRIRALEPDWDGVLPDIRIEDFYKPLKPRLAEPAGPPPPPRGLQELVESAGGLNLWSMILVNSLLSIRDRPSGLRMVKQHLAQKDWHLMAEARCLAAARVFLGQLPVQLREAAVDPDQIPALVTAVFLSDQAGWRGEQLESVAGLIGQETAEAAAMFREEMRPEQPAAFEHGRPRPGLAECGYEGKPVSGGAGRD